MKSEPKAGRVLITRSHEGNLELIPKLSAMGFETIAIDLLDLSPPEDWTEIDRRIADLDAYNWLVFTSQVGVRFFADRVRTTNPDAKRDGTKIACVGARTAAAASEAGWEVDFVPSRALTKALADELPGGGRVLVLRSDIADPALPQILRTRGFEVDDLIAYTTVVKERQPMEKVDEADLIIFGSPSSVQGLCSLLPGPVMSRAVAKRVACIGPVTARAARAHGFKRIVQPTDAYTFDALLEEVRKANVLE